jgi:hypothetical protein
MQIRNINFAAAISTVGEEFAYSIVHYGSQIELEWYSS